MVHGTRNATPRDDGMNDEPTNTIYPRYLKRETSGIVPQSESLVIGQQRRWRRSNHDALWRQGYNGWADFVNRSVILMSWLDSGFGLNLTAIVPLICNEKPHKPIVHFSAVVIRIII
jgi:hypothetical protein